MSGNEVRQSSLKTKEYESDSDEVPRSSQHRARCVTGRFDFDTPPPIFSAFSLSPLSSLLPHLLSPNAAVSLCDLRLPQLSACSPWRALRPALRLVAEASKTTSCSKVVSTNAETTYAFFCFLQVHYTSLLVCRYSCCTAVAGSDMRDTGKLSLVFLAVWQEQRGCLLAKRANGSCVILVEKRKTVSRCGKTN